MRHFLRSLKKNKNNFEIIILKNKKVLLIDTFGIKKSQYSNKINNIKTIKDHSR